MKKTLLCLLALSGFSLIVNAQKKPADSLYSKYRNTPRSGFNSTTLYSYSIGFKILSFEEFPKILNQVNTNDFRRSALNGFILKYNDNQISYRISGSFYSDRISFKNECDECEELAGRLTDNYVKLGFEKNILYSWLQPYFGIDLGLKRSIFKGTTQDVAVARNLSPSYDTKTEKNGLTLSPLFGIKLNIIDHFTIAAESTVDMFYCYERQERSFTDPAASPTVQKYHKWEFLLKPVGLFSLQYNFGAVY